MSKVKILRAMEHVIGKPASQWGGGPEPMSGKEWKARGEEYGTNAVLVVVYDGGAAAPYFEYDYECYSMIEKMNAALKKIGYYAEPCTSWYAGIYKI